MVDLIEEYKAAERPDYVTWGGSSSSTRYEPVHFDGGMMGEDVNK